VKGYFGKVVELFRGRDRGTGAVTFILAFPILLLVVAVIVQYALLANGRLAFERALTAGARSAMTSLPSDPDVDEVAAVTNVERATLLALAPLSPPGESASAEGVMLSQALAGVGARVPMDFARRFTFARTATVIGIEWLDDGGNARTAPTNFSRGAGGRVRITVAFPFRLNVPVANAMIGRSATVAGVSGRYFTFTSHVDVQLSDGRLVPADQDGEPTAAGRPE
jgi:hypothetical protein